VRELAIKFPSFFDAIMHQEQEFLGTHHHSMDHICFGLDMFHEEDLQLPKENKGPNNVIDPFRAKY
jgi:hypothetical protein